MMRPELNFFLGRLTYVIQWFSGKYSDSYHKKLLCVKILIVE